MRRLCGAILVAALFAGAPSFAQQESGPNGHPEPILQGQTTTPVAPPGGIDQAGVATPSAVPSAEATEPLTPGPAAGPARAAALSSVAFIGMGVAVSAAIVCALACFSNSSTTTTSTTPIHR